MNTLKIGQHCPAHMGIYAGIARSYANEPDNHIWLLDAKSPEEYMNWVDATTWAESLGEATGLPTRYEAALVGCNLTEELGDYGYMWTSTSDGAHRVWGQYCYSSSPGSQYSLGKTGTYRVRAVKRLPITYEMKGHPLATPAQAVQQDAERYRWLRDHRGWQVLHRIRPGKSIEYRMRDDGDWWGHWWPTHEQAVDAARAAQGGA